MKDLFMHKCYVCGKEFYVPDPSEWVYKKRDKHGSTLYFCTYSCKNRWAKEKGHKR